MNMDSGGVEERPRNSHFSLSLSLSAMSHNKHLFRILVRMDDNIIRHYSNEDTFTMEIRSEAFGDVTKHTITLTEV